MELDRFDEVDVAPTSKYGDGVLTPQQTLGAFDDLWYALTYRRARWMDLMGDYAGNELFILDGESLIQQVLDDPLLALGRNDDCGFQILHAYHILEQALLEFRRRSANFEIVFWQAFCHGTIKTGDTAYVTSSRVLARTMLFKHLSKIDGISVHVFKDLEDPTWKHYLSVKKPMFVMANDGGTHDSLEKLNQHSARYILNKRLLLFHLLTGGVSFARLNEAEYRESKILTFVNEQTRDREARKLFPQNFWDAVSDSENTLTAALHDGYLLNPHAIQERSMEHMLSKLAQDVAELTRRKEFANELLYLFLLHCLLLPGLSAQARARKERKEGKAEKKLREFFLPAVYSALARHSTEVRDCVDIDGRLFVSILHVVGHRKSSVMGLVPQSIHTTLQSIWSALDFPEPNFPSLAKSFNFKEEGAAQKSIVKAHSLLPFENEVFDSELKVVNVENGVPQRGNSGTAQW